MSIVRATSHAAGKEVKRSGRAGTLRARVFVQILRSGVDGATLDELEQIMGVPGNTLRPRRVELHEKGFVIDSGKRRPTRTGKDAIVWIVPESIATKARLKLRAKGVES